MKRKVLVCGSRNLTEPMILVHIFDSLIKPDDHVIFGDARGVDFAIHLYCHIKGIDHDEPYEADWDLFGKAAGPIRNSIMVDKCNIGICIGKTKGTLDTKRKLFMNNKLLGWFNIDPTMQHRIIEITDYINQKVNSINSKKNKGKVAFF